MSAAIQFKDVEFYYSKKLILDQINLKVPYGKIYSLLGPSGAGKTTLLRLALGRIKPSSGEIKVLGESPGKNNRLIGYMPQDQALCKTFTVGQTLQYFANIYRLSRKQFIERKANLQNNLGLPNDNAKISQLSGGQQKIVSLSVTFLQQPMLMILDEPTVGSDPTLGDYIWKYLHRLCSQENIVIVLVTHYIQEAALAHITGIMRDGKILEEGTPNMLIQKYQQKTLEDVFLYLCENNVQPFQVCVDKKESVKFDDAKHINLTKSKKSTEGFFSSFSLNLWILFVLIHKNLSRFFTLNVPFLIFLIPAFQALILGCVFNADNISIPIGVYNQEPDSEQSVRLLNKMEKFGQYILKPIQYDSLDSALDALHHTHVFGAISFDANFSESLITRITDPDSLESLDSSNVKVYLDNSNIFYAYGFIDSLRQTVYNFMSEIHADRNFSGFEVPIYTQEIIYADGAKMSDFLLPGYLIAFIYLSQVSLSSQLLIQERREGLFERSLVAGVGHNLVLLSHFFSSIILSIIQIILMLFVALYLFNLLNYGPLWLIFILVLAQALSAVATGLFISSIINQGSTATLLSIFITFSQLFTSGNIFPKEFSNINIQKYMYLSPIAIPGDSLRNVMLKNWDITHPYVYNGLLINLISTFILIFITSFTFKNNS